MTIEIQSADLRLRRVTIVVLSIALLAAIGLLFVFQKWMTHEAASLPTTLLVAEVRRLFGAMMVATAVCLLLLAAYAARQARRIVRERRWPLATSRVLRDTAIRRDAAALARARMLDLIAVVLLALAIGGGALAWRLFVTGP